MGVTALRAPCEASSTVLNLGFRVQGSGLRSPKQRICARLVCGSTIGFSADITWLILAITFTPRIPPNNP